MARVHQRKAAKDYPESGIRKGETYYTWTLRFSKFGAGVTYKSKTPPRSSQTTSSEFYSQLYSIQEALEDAVAAAGSREELADALESASSDAGDLRDETQEKLDNMPEGLQQGGTGELLQERVDALDAWQQELDDAAQEARDFEPEEGEEEGEFDVSQFNVPEVSV